MRANLREIHRFLAHHDVDQTLASALALLAFVVGFGTWAFALGFMVGGF